MMLFVICGGIMGFLLIILLLLLRKIGIKENLFKGSDKENDCDSDFIGLG